MSITAAGSTVTNNTPGVATFNTTVTPSAIGDVLVVYMNATRPANMWFAAGSVTSGSGYIAALIVTPTGGVTSVNATLVDGAEPLSNLVTDGTNVYVLL